MRYKELNKSIENHVIQFFEHHTDSSLLFHNLNHTRMVVYRAGQISGPYELPESQQFVLTVAAWFHDIGYLSGGQPGHELRGASMARSCLIEQQVGIPLIAEVVGCILATAMPQRPFGLLQQILCDADLFHLGTPELFSRNKLLKKEADLHASQPIEESQWLESTIRLLETHRFHTEYCRSLLTDKKNHNLAKMRRMLQEKPDEQPKLY